MARSYARRGGLRRIAPGKAVNVTLVKSRGEGPGRRFRSVVQQREKCRDGIPARKRKKNIQLYLRQVVKPVVQDALERAKICRSRDMLERQQVQIRVVPQVPSL